MPALVFPQCSLGRRTAWNRSGEWTLAHATVTAIDGGLATSWRGAPAVPGRIIERLGRAPCWRGVDQSSALDKDSPAFVVACRENDARSLTQREPISFRRGRHVER